LSQAAINLKKSTIARDLFGDEFVDHFAYTREWEDNQQRAAITDWQLKRYFEII
jgi:glutamine synthetase